MAESNDESGEVIFVGGAMRSGTTLLQRILCSTPASNPLITECRYLYSIMQLHENSLRDFDLRVKDYFGGEARFDAFTRESCRRFLAATRERYPEARKLVLKSPELTRHFPTLARWLPGSRFAVIVRDPRDTIASMLEVSRRHREEGRASHMARLGDDMGRYVGAYLSYYAPLLPHAALLEGRILMLRYEDLVRDLDRHVSELAAFSGLDLDAAVLRQAAEPASTWESRRSGAFSAAFWSPSWERPPADDRIGSYKERLAAAAVAEIERRGADFARRFGYW